MRKSSTHQQQTHTLLNPHPVARYNQNHLAINKKRSSVKRMSAIILGALAGSSLPALALALHSQVSSDVKIETPTTQLHVKQQNASSDEGAVAGSSADTNSSASVKVESTNSSTTDGSSEAQVTINGQTVPLENGSISQHYTDDSGAKVDISVTVDGSTQTSSSNSSSTNIVIDSSSSSSGDTTRGSPRR